MRRLLWLGLVLLLWVPAQAQRVPADKLLVGSLVQTVRYGNYAAAEPILSFLKDLLKADASATDFILAVELLVKTCEGQYATGFALAEKALTRSGASPELVYASKIALAVGGYRAGRPELTDRYLPDALAYAVKQQDFEGDRFMLETLAFQRELEKNPNLPTQVAFQRHDEAWAHLATYKPPEYDCSGTQIWEAADYWFLWMSRASENHALDEELKKHYVSDHQILNGFTETTFKKMRQASSAPIPMFEVNPQYVIGEAESYLTLAEIQLRRGQPERADTAINDAELVLKKMYSATATGLDELNRQLLALEGKALGLPSPPPLGYSLLDGDLSLVKARADILRARVLLASPKTDAQAIARLLREAEAAQQAGRRGQGFLGLKDVRWTQLEALTKLRPKGWEDQAAQLAEAGLKECREVGFRPGEILALTYLGQAKKSTTLLQEAIKLIEAYLQESQSSGARAQYQRTYDLLAELQLQKGEVKAAAETLGRSQQLPAVGLSKNLPKVQALRGQQEALQAERTSRKALGQSTEVVDELIARTKGEFYTELLKIKQDNPKYESMLAIRPVNFAQLQKQIPANTCVIQYFPAEAALYVFVATTTDLKIHKVQVAGEKLTQLITSYRQALMKTQQENDSAAQLYNLLIRPLEGDLSAKEVLAFIPTATLNYLPMPALKAPDGRYLIEKKQCVTIVKAGDLEALGAPPTAARGGVLALGNPDGSLPAAAQEAQAVTAMFPGSQTYLGGEATPDHLVAAGKAGYLHLATHGVLDARDPSNSYLLVAGSEPRLKVPQIFELKLDGVRLVTLSACQTAVGKDNVGAGSELTTLAFAFSVAGSNSVLASLWSVSDESTRELMTAFYAGVKEGLPLSKALQVAQLKLLADPRFKSPFYWAPFVLLGDWR